MILENNTLLAEFMEFQKTDLGWYDAEETLIKFEKDNTFDDLKFNSDWNWLMTVIEKILEICYATDDEKYEWERFYLIKDEIPNIESTYNAVVEFIKWYNKITQ